MDLIKLNEDGMAVWRHKKKRNLFVQRSYEWCDRVVVLNECSGQRIVTQSTEFSTFDFADWIPVTVEEFSVVKQNFIEIYDLPKFPKADPMSMLFDAAGDRVSDRVSVRTSGMRDPGEHELVWIGTADSNDCFDAIPLDEFCKTIKDAIDGQMSLGLGSFLVEQMFGIWVFEKSEGSFALSGIDFYRMVRYVMTNTDTYIPMDPRPGLFDWVCQQDEVTADHAGAMERNRFIEDCKEGGVVFGFNPAGVRLEIPGMSTLVLPF